MKFTDDQIADIGEEIIRILKTVYDPEIPVDIYELGLIYDVQISEEADVKIIMTLNHTKLSGCRNFTTGSKRQGKSRRKCKRSRSGTYL